jgi:exopolysaccharide biosynthesis polyprenyl glycosylphosphotransferase
MLVNEAKRRFLLSALKSFDLGLLAVSFLLATVLVGSDNYSASLGQFLAMRIKVSNLGIMILILVGWHIVFSMFGLYASKRLATPLSVIVDLLKATMVATICLMIAGRVFSIVLINFDFLILFWTIGSALVAIGRTWLLFMLGNIRRHGRNLRHVLVLGTNERAVEFAKRIETSPELGYRILGFVDDDWQGTPQFVGSGYALCSDFGGFSDFLRCNVVDEVASFVPLRSFYEQASRVATLCEQHGVVLRFDSDIFNLKISRARSEDFHGTPHIAAYAGALSGRGGLAKRFLDIVISSVLLVMLAPILLIVSLLIMVTSDGPILFSQERVGLNKRRFRIHKFRTMVANAEKMLAELESLNEVSGPVFKIRNDPRLTPVGKYLRRTSLDELPQLYNVLTGDMSLVGPRPLPVRDYEGFHEDWQRRRFSVRPGITCIWQVNGRNSIPFDQWMEMDMQYLDQWSLWLDFKILVSTIPAVLKGSGAA